MGLAPCLRRGALACEERDTKLFFCHQTRGAGLRKVLLAVALLLAFYSTLALAVTVLPKAPEPPQTPPGGSMNIAQAALLGLVEGLTEYLPVSSTGHLLLAQQLAGMTGGESADATANPLDAYAICIQAGAILAVLLLYTRRVGSVLAGILGKDKSGRRLGINLVAAFAPAALAGFLLEDLIKQYLFGLWPIVLAWFVGGIAILLVARKENPDATPGKQLEELSPLQALLIGAIQCIAMWPGVSRSLVTILGGMLVGLSVVAAVEFSFLLGLVTLGAATLWEALKFGPDIIQVFGWVNPLTGFIVACVSALTAVKWMVSYLTRHGLAIFGYYRLALSLVITGLLLGGYLVNK